MIIRKAVATAALLVAGDPELELAGISVDGPFLVFDFTGEDTLAGRLEIVAAWDATVGGLIADADDGIEIANLTAFKRAIADVIQDVTRESYIQDAQTASNAEATDDSAISHPTSTGAASTSLSSQQGADDENEEKTNEQAQQEERPRRRQRR